jgi:hypothetical protein
MKGSSGI